MAKDDEKKPRAGYRNPPQETRFRKGISGNPRGRPKAPNDLRLAQLPLLSSALAAARKSVTMREGGKTSVVTALDALVSSLMAQAIKGNARAAGLLLDVVNVALIAEARELQEQIEFWSHYKEVMSAEIRKAIDRGESPPAPLPHPEDIFVDTTTGVKFHGPVDDDGQRRLEETLRYREVLLMQHALDERSYAKLGREGLIHSGGALLMAMVLDRSVPPRLRLTDTGWIAAGSVYDRLTKRQLQKQLYQTWRKLGKKIPRGTITPSEDTIRRRLSFLFEFIKAARGGSIDVDALLRGEPDEAFEELQQKFG